MLYDFWKNSLAIGALRKCVIPCRYNRRLGARKSVSWPSFVLNEREVEGNGKGDKSGLGRCRVL